MTVRDLSDAIRPAPPLQRGDTAAKAVRLMRAKGVPALPVADGMAIVGVVSERDILHLVSGTSDVRQALQALPVAQLMRPAAVVGTDHQSLVDLAEAVRSSPTDGVPVVDAGRRYLGMLLTRDILAALAEEPIVPPVAGLATPGGVYLSTGAVRAGAGDLGLAATGAALMLLDRIADGVVLGASRLALGLLKLPADVVRADQTGAASVALAAVLFGLHVLIFLVLLRLSPLTGTHGAEHMVVRAIEEGEDLELQKVRQMPRVHPRCGTNLLALLILLTIAHQSLLSLGNVGYSTGMLALFFLVVIVLLTWRRLGAGLQRWVTTKMPSDRQLDAAVKVGQDLLAKIRARPSTRVSAPLRLWNTGFIQVLLGFFAVALAVQYAPVVLGELRHLLAH